MYHRLARTDRYRWWKPLAELVLFGVLVVLLWRLLIPTIYDVVGPADDGAPGIIKLGLTIAWINRRGVDLHPSVPKPDYQFPNVASLLTLVDN